VNIGDRKQVDLDLVINVDSEEGAGLIRAIAGIFV
jgi:hypothetical protein